MDCQIAQISLSAHLDGCLSDADREELVRHLGQCAACDLRLGQLARVRAMVKRLPSPPPPAHLTSALRVIASRERARILARRNPLGYWGERLRLFVDNLMRPMAIPLAGGLVSALVLFSMLMPNIRLKADPRINDIPLSLIYTDPKVKEQTPFGFNYDDDFVVAVVVDAEGRAVDYSIPDGEQLPKNADWRRMIQTDLLFTQFTPATAYGRPTMGKMFLSFSRSTINVPGKS